MPTSVDIFVPLTDLASKVADHAASRESIEQALRTLAIERAARAAGVSREQIFAGQFLRKSLDARKGHPIGFRIQVELTRKSEAKEAAPFALFSAETPHLLKKERLQALAGMASADRMPQPQRLALGSKRHAVVVGSGPAGTFCALRLRQAGVQVTLLEQGKQVQPRRRDLALLTRGQLVHFSNYCFGEGGAGTYSDGKLYTRCKDRLGVKETLYTLIEHGAEPDIAIESRPHIGSNRLPQILATLRQHLIELGVEYRFGECVSDFLLSPSGQLRGVCCSSGLTVEADVVVLAVGHSARGIYELCARRGVALAQKAFAIGARVEHPQPLIDRLQYGDAALHPALPAAFYQLTAQAQGRGVYSFCMCPGGWVVPSATEPEGLCTNGMSLKRRDSPLANAALVVSVEPADYAAWGQDAADPLAGVQFQRAIERSAYVAGGGDFCAPAQRLVDFVHGRPSDSVLRSTYRPGIRPADLAHILPKFIVTALAEGARRFERTMPGFLGAEAQLVGVETRTSSPVRIVRDAAFMSPSLPGLYPIGEGAGYAGGIVSAAIDGLRAADAVLSRFS